MSGELIGFRWSEARFGVVCYFRHISTHVRARERLKLLIDELNHRAKNTLAVVQFIACKLSATRPLVPRGDRLGFLHWRQRTMC
jgi:HWE histidine kinase